MNYAIYTYNKALLIFFGFFEMFPKFESCFAFLVYFVQRTDILNIVFGFCASNCIWGYRLNVFLNILSKCFKKCPTSVNNFRTEDLLGIFGPKWSPSG